MILKTIIAIEIVVFAIASIFSKKIRNYSFYYSILEHSKSSINSLISVKERAAYFLTKVVSDVPSFSFAPTNYDYWKYESERSYANTQFEKNVYRIISIKLLIQSIVGNIVYDLIIVMTVFYFKGYISFSKIGKWICSIFDVAAVIDAVSKTAITVFEWIQNNVNLFLVVIVILLSLYIGWQKRKRRKYAIEAVWAEAEADRIRKVADIQKKLEEELIQFKSDLYHNMLIIRDAIRCTNDSEIAQIPCLKDYSGTTDEIKKLLSEITEVEGWQVFFQRNKRMYVQLTILELLPSFSDEKYFINLERLSKTYIEKYCKKKSDLFKSYAYGIAFMNGINRLLQFSYKKRKQYNRIVMHITDADYLKSIFEYAADQDLNK